MPVIKEFVIDPPTIACGDSVEMRVTIEFAGPPEDVSVEFSIDPPCRFHNGSTSIVVTKNGPSPQTIRVVEPVMCPAGQFFAMVAAEVSDDSRSSDQANRPLTVQC